VRRTDVAGMKNLARPKFKGGERDEQVRREEEGRGGRAFASLDFQISQKWIKKDCPQNRKTAKHRPQGGGGSKVIPAVSLVETGKNAVRESSQKD